MAKHAAPRVRSHGRFAVAFAGIAALTALAFCVIGAGLVLQSGKTGNANLPEATLMDDDCSDTLTSMLSTVEKSLDSYPTYTPAVADVFALEADDDIFGFCLGSSTANADADASAAADAPTPVSANPTAGAPAAASAPELSAETKSQIKDALLPYFKAGNSAGFMLVDLNTGRGFAYNIDEDLYVASSVKAPFCLYLCETLLDVGAVAPDDSVPYMVSAADLDGTLGNSLRLEDLIELSIVKSANDEYRILRAAYEGAPFAAWLKDTGLDTTFDTSWFPAYSVRESAALWLHAACYLESDAASAAWFGSLLEQTETSFLRDGVKAALEDDERYAFSPVDVQSKAGWNSEGYPYNATCDSGLVRIGEHTYLVTVLTEAPDSTPARENLVELIRAIFAAREDLA